MEFTEAQIEKMASQISQTEKEKCKNAIRMISDAMKKLDYREDENGIQPYNEEGSYSYILEMYQKNSNKNIILLVQGSYANKTNIPSESDVDVAVILESTFIPNYRIGVVKEQYGFTEGDFSIEELKNEVLNALNQHFNFKGVTRHDKSIKVHGNTYRVDADVVPAYRYRDYINDYGNNPQNYIAGIQIRPDSGGKIINYPEQHIKSGIEKNKLTEYNFKKCVRIIKNMRDLMQEHGYVVSDKISSFGLESLLWNVNDFAYTKYSYLCYTFEELLIYLEKDFLNFSDYKEVNGIKYLFTDETMMNAYKNFIHDLKIFFKYDVSGV